MGLLFNGTTITTASNNVYFNGTVVNKVYFNGTELWAKQTIPVWNGNSIAQNVGIDVTANLCRAKSTSTYHSWITATASGFNTVQSGTNTGYNIKSQGNIFTQLGNVSNSQTSCTWNLTTRLWTGNTTATIEKKGDMWFVDVVSLQTAGGLIRAGYAKTTRGDEKQSHAVWKYGAYISLK